MEQENGKLIITTYKIHKNMIDRETKHRRMNEKTKYVKDEIVAVRNKILLDICQKNARFSNEFQTHYCKGVESS